MSANLHPSEGTHRISTRGLLISILFLLSACDNDSKKEEDAAQVLLAADPPSLVQGESIVSTLIASEPFFSEALQAPLTSEGGLTLDSLIIRDEQTALATFKTAAGTAVGSHRFELESGGTTSELTVSVLAEQPGPGTITTRGNIATAGARMASLSILGKGTRFDSETTVHVEGADGLEVRFVNVITQTWIDVMYNIDIDQEPIQAAVVLQDGGRRYEAPFTIVSPAVFESQASNQVLVRGQVGRVTLSHPEASLHFCTHFQIDDESIETGSAEVVRAGTEVRIPMRVPLDFAGDTLSLTASSFSEGGAVLEMMEVNIALLEPAYLAFVPSRLDKDEGESSVGIVTQGLDLTALESLTVEENDHVVLSGWETTAAKEGSAEFVFSSDTEEGAYRLVADDGARQVTGVVAVVDWDGQAAYRAQREVAAGDRVFFPIVVKGHDLVEGDSALSGDSGVEVLSLIHIDEGCVVAELEVDKNASKGLRALELRAGEKDYHVYIEVIESGL